MEAISRKYKYTSLEYMDEEDIQDAIVLYQDKDTIFLYKEIEDTIELFWGADSKEGFIRGLNSSEEFIQGTSFGKNLYIKFIPKEFIDDLEEKGFKVTGEFVDFWNRDLDSISIVEQDNLYIRRIKEDEYSRAGQITRDCAGYSREFIGEEDEWIKEWNESDDSCILIGERDENILGICCINLYGFESEKGIILWIREIAVDPRYHNEGVGRALLTHAIQWGKEKGAKRSFLACDVENHSGIKLYESLGYVRGEGQGEIRMKKTL